jgi:hypothetical protein
MNKHHLTIINIIALLSFTCFIFASNFALEHVTNERISEVMVEPRMSSVWSTTEVISTESTQDSSNPQIAINTDGSISVVWNDYTDYAGSGTDKDIFFKRWNAATKTWSGTEIVSTESTLDSDSPTIALDSLGNLYVTWNDYTNYQSAGTDMDIFFKMRNATTGLWSMTEVVSTESTALSSRPSVVVDYAGNVYVAWQDGTDYQNAGTELDIFFKIRNATTGFWTITEVVTTESVNHSYAPKLDVDDRGNIYLVWDERSNFGNSGDDQDIFFKIRNATTGLWSATEVVSTESTSDSTQPTIKCDKFGNVHCAWGDYSNYLGCGTDLDLFYKMRNATTGLWTITQVVSTESTGGITTPSLCVDDSLNVYFVWPDSTDLLSSGSDWDIFCKILNSTTGLLSPLELISSESTSESMNCNCAIDQYGNLHVVWSDNTNYLGADTDRDIFYKRRLIVPQAPNVAPIASPSTTGNIILSWNNVKGATSYKIYRTTAPINDIVGLTPLIADYPTTTYNDNGLPLGTFYYVVVATNVFVNSTPSNCVSVSVQRLPNAPILNPIASPSTTGNVILSWNLVPGATSYKIYRNTSMITNVTGLIPIASGYQTNSFSDQGLANGTYYYVIIAVNGTGNSAISNCEFVTVTLPATTTSTPTTSTTTTSTPTTSTTTTSTPTTSTPTTSSATEPGNVDYPLSVDGYPFLAIIFLLGIGIITWIQKRNRNRV